MFKVFMEDQFIGEFDNYQDAVDKAREDGKTGANFIGCLAVDNKEIYTFVFSTPTGDEQVDFIVHLP